VKVPPRTPRVAAAWITVSDVAQALGIHRSTAFRRLKDGSIPGLERMYTWDDGRVHWHVLRSAFEAWRSQHAPALAS
jgi:predicted DNA-binding transcriptional regulator AlpA